MFFCLQDMCRHMYLQNLAKVRFHYDFKDMHNRLQTLDDLFSVSLALIC